MRTRAAVLGCTVAFALVMSSGCTVAPGGDKAGAPAGSVVLQMAVTGTNDPVDPGGRFAQRLLDLSDGTIRVQFLEGWGQDAADSEEQVVRAVASGRVDLGATGARAFDTMGVDSFQALLAPMLIDSRALQDAVLRGDLPREMLGGVKSVGVIGLALASGGLRRPFSKDRPLLDLADWRGVGFGTSRSRIQEATISALGARPVEAVGPFAEHAVTEGRMTAFASELGGYVEQTSTIERLRFGTSNVVLWPGFGVLVANPGRLASLTDRQRAWIREAAGTWTTAFERSMSGEDAAARRRSCAAGARFAFASPMALAAMRRAVVPVYERIERDPQTRAAIRQIRALKRTMPGEAVIPIPPTCRWHGSG